MSPEYGIMKTKLSKLIVLLVLTVVLASPAAFAVSLSTFIEGVSQITCKQGDKIDVTAHLVCENSINGLWNNSVEYEDLHFYLYSLNYGEDNKKVFEKTEETSFLRGKATVHIDTKNLNPGEYLLKVEFEGDKGIFVNFEPNKIETNFTINP